MKNTLFCCSVYFRCSVYTTDLVKALSVISVDLKDSDSVVQQVKFQLFFEWGPDFLNWRKIGHLTIKF